MSLNLEEVISKIDEKYNGADAMKAEETPQTVKNVSEKIKKFGVTSDDDLKSLMRSSNFNQRF